MPPAQPAPEHTHDKPNRRFQLRASTSAAHAALEAELGPLDTVSGYARYLRGLHAFRAGAEMAVQAAKLADLAGWRPHRIADELARDVSDLGLTPLPPIAITMSNDIADMLGLAYVLEGSSLGARLLWNKAQALGFHEMYGARHLAAQTASAEGWARIVVILNQSEDIDIQSIADFAKAHFAAAQLAMTRAAYDL